ncbi:MAG TPA: 2-C-methyl-D-erythritol 4-phosphate cytidylyltransferase [Caproiciproducens sp.]|nr:2-C-methyl-D-erythritol 4-phosphate cytidylyltransferase [Caproiciproducens sp.]
MTGNIKCCAIIVSAGNSTRMAAATSKQFLIINKIPVLIRTLLAFEAAEAVDSVLVVSRKEDIRDLEKLILKYSINKVYKIVTGGQTRQQSVFAGISAAPQDAGCYAIHDGARALITPNEIDTVIQDGIKYGASALAVPVKDTIKVVNEDGFVTSTPDRSSLWAVQTPQVFQKALYLSAMEKAINGGADYTDDCQLAEHAGVRVHLCRGTYTNLKLTTADDIPVSEAILSKREGTV